MRPNDTPYPPPAPKPDVVDGSPLAVAPASIQVTVLNGSNTAGAATSAAAELTALGYQVVGVANAESTDFISSVVRYDPASISAADAARTVSAALGNATRVHRAGLGAVVQVVVGDDWSGAASVVVKIPKVPSDGVRTAAENICS